MYDPCDLCGADDPAPVLESPRLDGPLVRCRRCGMVYVGRRGSDFTFAERDDERSEALHERLATLAIVDQGVEEAEQPLRAQADADRLALLRQHVDGGRLLDVGCSTGGFLRTAAASFDVAGVEPDPGTSELARAAGLEVVTGTLRDLPDEPFDAITMFHVIEHARSPLTELGQVRRLLKPGGTVLIETPTVDGLLFRLTKSRWRQLIPDHYFFFSERTLGEALRRCDLQPVAFTKVGRRVSLRFAADRLRRSGVPLAGAAAAAVRRLGVEDRTVRLTPGDIMAVVATTA